MGAITTKTFRIGDGVAVVLPEEWGLGPDLTVSVERDGDALQVHAPEPTVLRTEAEKLQRFQAMLRRLDELGPVGEIQNREDIRIEFPDRPGLY